MSTWKNKKHTFKYIFNGEEEKLYGLQFTPLTIVKYCFSLLRILTEKPKLRCSLPSFMLRVMGKILLLLREVVASGNESIDQ
jgi:hypothetical protein